MGKLHLRRATTDRSLCGRIWKRLSIPQFEAGKCGKCEQLFKDRKEARR